MFTSSAVADEKTLALGGRNRLGIGQRHGLRILVHAADAIFVVQVRAGGEAGHADVADDLPELDALTALQTALRSATCGRRR